MYDYFQVIWSLKSSVHDSWLLIDHLVMKHWKILLFLLHYLLGVIKYRVNNVVIRWKQQLLSRSFADILTLITDEVKVFSVYTFMSKIFHLIFLHRHFHGVTLGVFIFYSLKNGQVLTSFHFLKARSFHLCWSQASASYSSYQHDLA